MSRRMQVGAQPTTRDEFVKRLVAASFDIGESPYPTLGPGEWTGKVDALVHSITEVFGGTKEK